MILNPNQVCADPGHGPGHGTRPGHYVSLCFTMFSTGQARRLFGGCTLLNSLRSSHLDERSELDRCNHQTVRCLVGANSC